MSAIWVGRATDCKIIFITTTIANGLRLLNVEASADSPSLCARLRSRRAR
jgi:hypothetical protein